MHELYNWRPTANSLPENHLRITLDTDASVQAGLVVSLAAKIIEELVELGLLRIELVHAGRGSTTVEVSISEQQEQANLEKTRAEIAKIKADTRFKNVQTGVLLGPFVAALATIAISIADGESPAAKMLYRIAQEGSATICTFMTGETCFDLILAEESVNGQNENDQISAVAYVESFVAGVPHPHRFETEFDDERTDKPIKSDVIIPAGYRDGEIATIEGYFLIENDVPKVQTDQALWEIRGIKMRLPFMEGARIQITGNVEWSARVIFPHSAGVVPKSQT